MNLVLDKDYVFKRKKIGRVGIIDVGSNSVRLVVFAGFFWVSQFSPISKFDSPETKN